MIEVWNTLSDELKAAFITLFVTLLLAPLLTWTAKKWRVARHKKAQMVSKIDEMHRMYLNFSAANQRAIEELKSMIRDTGQCRAERTREVNDKFDGIEDVIKKNEIAGIETKTRVDSMSESLKEVKNQLRDIEKKVEKSQITNNEQFAEINQQLIALHAMMKEVIQEKAPMPVPYPPTEEPAEAPKKVVKKSIRKKG